MSGSLKVKAGKKETSLEFIENVQCMSTFCVRVCVCVCLSSLEVCDLCVEESDEHGGGDSGERGR